MGDVKSLRSKHCVAATFKNKSERTVELYWVDYKGELVLYFKNFSPGQEKKMNTYVTHPWVARDSETGQWLRMNGNPAYVTPMPDGIQQDEEEDPENVDPRFVGSVEVNIHIPVYKLQDVVIGFLRKHLKSRTLTEELLNHYLLDQLSNVPKLSARVYRPGHGIFLTDD